MASENTIFINGKPLTFTEGETVLEVARRNGIFIPTFCHLRDTAPTGACRVCVVEVEGAKNLMASCAMPAARNMTVFTDSPRVVEARRMVISLLMISGNHNCAARGSSCEDWSDFQAEAREYDGSDEICDAYGRCYLQELAYRYQANQVISSHRLRTLPVHYSLEKANPFIMRDFSRCILCGRCVKACSEIQVNNAISIGYRGQAAKIVTRGDRPLAQSDCVFCGECVQVCPVAALVEKDARYNTRHWEMEKTPSACGYCSVGCAVDIFTRESAVIKIDGIENGLTANNGSLCAMGRYGFRYLTGPERITKPMIRKEGKLAEVHWDEALTRIADRLKEIKEKHGPDSIAGIASARYTNEDCYAMGKFFRAVIGTNNIDNTSRLFDAPVTEILGGEHGLFSSAGSLARIEAGGAVLLAGSGVNETHPVAAAFMKRAAAVREGELIVIDPLLSRMAFVATRHLPAGPGTETALIYGMIQVLFDEGLYDKNCESIEGFAALKEKSARFTPGKVSELTGIAPELVAETARKLTASGPPCIVIGPTLMQSPNGAESVRALVDLAQAAGSISTGGFIILRSPGNGQGACDSGALPGYLPGYRSLENDKDRKAFETAWGGKIPASRGRTIPEMIKGIEDGTIRALYLMGNDPVRSFPGGEKLAGLLGKLDFLAVHDIMRGGAVEMAEVAIPSRALPERDGTVTGMDRRVQLVRKAVDPPVETREDWRVFGSIASILGHEMQYSSAEEVFRELTTLSPIYSSMSYQRLDRPGGLQWPCNAAVPDGTKTIDAGTLKLKFHGADYAPAAPDKKRPFTLVVTDVVRDYYRETGELDFLYGGGCVVNPADAERLGLSEGGDVNLSSEHGSAVMAAVIDPKVPEGTVSISLNGTDVLTGQLVPPGGVSSAGAPQYQGNRVAIEKKGR